MTTTRDRRLLAALVVAGLAAVGAVTWPGRDHSVDDATVRSACHAVVAYRQAFDASSYVATRDDLLAALPTLGSGDRAPAVDVRAYARALLGAPADGSGHLLLAAAEACRAAGAPALYRELAPLLD